MVRSVDVARHIGVSKPSVCHAVTTLRDSGFLTMDKGFFLHLTDVGRTPPPQADRKMGPLYLTHLEFFTLAYLAQHPGWLFTQEQIYEAVWHEFPKGCGANVVNIISQFCRKMEPGNPIRTAPYSSYKFELTPVT